MAGLRGSARPSLAAEASAGTARTASKASAGRSRLMREMLASGAERVILSAMPNDLSIAAALGALLKERKQTLAVAESSAGGLISAALLAVPGASAYFLGGGVIYTQAARRGLLRVGDEAVKGIRSSSEPYAQLKAKAVRELMGATWGLAETGASGPTGNRYGDAAGHACIAVAGPVQRVVTVGTGDADRERNMWAFTRAALKLLEDAVR